MQTATHKKEKSYCGNRNFDFASVFAGGIGSLRT